MTPRSFDYDTSREMVGHERALTIEDRARRDAEADNYAPPPGRPGGTYWDQAQSSFEWVTYNAVYFKRREKIERAEQPLTEVSFDPRLDTIATDVIARSEKAVNEYKSGKEKALNSLVGMVIGGAKKEGIPADATTINALLKQKLQG